MIKENFIPLGVRAGEQDRKNGEGEFIRQCQVHLLGASANLAVVTASGRRLGVSSGPLDPYRALQGW